MADNLEARVVDTLKNVLDPKTTGNVWDMKFVRDLEVKEDGDVRLTFRPPSVVCPMGFSLGAQIKESLMDLEGVKKVTVRVEEFNQAEALESALKAMDEGSA